MLFGIFNNIVNYDSNYYKRSNYIDNIYKNNHENNLYTSLPDIGIEKDYVYSRCIFSDINN